MVFMLYILDRVTERAGRALLYCLDNLFDSRPIRINPRFLPQLENRFQIVRAMTDMSANTAVVVDRDLLANIVFTFVGGTVRQFFVLEPIFAVRAVAERLVFRTAATA